MRRLSGLTCSPSEAQSGAARWIASLPDSLARTSASPAAALGLTANARVCSSTSSTLPTIAVRGSSLWRTSAPSLLQPPPLWTRRKASSTKERPPESWENWPTAGGTRSGSLYRRPMWEPATGGPGGSASRGGWPTPDAAMHAGANRSESDGAAVRPNISLAAKQWLTPHGMAGMDHSGKPGAGGEFARQATQWLTPNVPNGGRSVPAQLVASKGTTEDGDKRTVGLESQTKHWGTPQARDYRSPDSPDSPNYLRKVEHGYTIDLNTQAVAWARPPPTEHGRREGWPESGGEQGRPDAAERGGAVADAESGRTGAAELAGRLPSALFEGAAVAHPSQPRPQGNGSAITQGGGELEPCNADGSVLPLFAPGPADPRWAGIIAGWPWLAPATESGVRMLVDGPALLVDESRSHQLRQVGNGVVPLQAAAAFVLLVRRARGVAT